MARFKPGDKVRLIKNSYGYRGFDGKYLEVGTILEVSRANNRVIEIQLVDSECNLVLQNILNEDVEPYIPDILEEILGF